MTINLENTLALEAIAFERDPLRWMEGSDAFVKPQQRRSKESLGRIVTSAVNLFATKGLDATRVADIASGARVPVGTVYKHFADKEALLAAIVAGYRACRMREITELCTSPAARAASPRQIVELHLNIVFTAFTVDAGLLRLIERQRLENPAVHQDQSNANDVVASLVADLLVDKLPDRDPERLRRQVLYAHSIIRGAVVWSVLPIGGEYGRGLKVTDVDFASEALEMALRYLRIES